jgi:hypothetical protein
MTAPARPRLGAGSRATGRFLAAGSRAASRFLAAAPLLLFLLASCSKAPEVDPSQLRVFFSSDAIGYLEPCG